jgi:hypothetical protein
MKKGQFPLVCVINIASFINVAFAQSTPGEIQTKKATVTNAIDLYYVFIGEGSHLYNGSEYESPVYTQDLHPFFKAMAFSSADIFYDGTLYHDVPAMYDIIKDELIVNRYKQNMRIVLSGEKIQYFSLRGHFFVRLIQDSVNEALVKTGFYERLYGGKVNAYAKRQKKAEEKIVDNNPVVKIEEADHYMVERNGIFFPVRNQKTLLAAFRDKKKDLRKYLRKNAISFHKNRENTIIAATKYYDQLLN